MTRPEMTHQRDLTFSGWIRKNLPDSKTGFLASDLDFILCNYKSKKVMMLEVKQFNSELPKWQKILFNNIAEWIGRGIFNGWTFLGFHVIQFEQNDFEDGKCYLDGKEISEKDLIERLSF